MALRISGKNLDIGQALREQIEARVATSLGKYFDGRFSGHVTVARDGIGFRTDCVLHLDSGTTLEATGSGKDAYASFEQTADRIDKRLRRYKRRLKSRAVGGNGGEVPSSAYTVIASPGEEEPLEDVFHPVVVAETTRPLHRLSVSEAVLELDFTGTPVLVFRHAGSGRVNVVYRRSDGMIGWIDPPAD